ncbi:MAG: class I SAM-dependent methyltransferase [Candidatus Levybacteria bacterium]|nr:class I SAM-dependent methyltransferase [Candidatus Levybacteria bacterium]
MNLRGLIGPLQYVEEKLFSAANRIIPGRIFKYLPTIYYNVNRYRFRVLKRPTIKRETSKARSRRDREGFFAKYCRGQGLDVGYGGDVIVPGCRGWDIEHGDAHLLAGVPDAEFDFVYSSHLLEHLADPTLALRNWWRVVKPGGYLLLYVPERNLAERKKTLPSDLSLDHKHYFLVDRDDPPDTIGLVPLIERLFADAKIVYAKICKEGYDPNVPAKFNPGEFSIECVLKKPR